MTFLEHFYFPSLIYIIVYVIIIIIINNNIKYKIIIILCLWHMLSIYTRRDGRYWAIPETLEIRKWRAYIHSLCMYARCI